MKFQKAYLHLIVPVLFSLALPITSQAATEAESLYACAVAFVKKLEDSRQTKFRMRVGAENVQSRFPLSMPVTMFKLKAYDAEGTQTFAKADCYVNAKGDVTSIRNVFQLGAD